MRLRKIALFTVAAALALPLFAGPQKAGKWQITAQMSMVGMDMKMPATTIEHCVTAEEAEKPQPPKMRNNDDCKFEDYKIDGSTVTWKMNCAKQGMSGEGKITYSAEAFDGTMSLKAQGHDMTVTYTGKRLGDCDK